MAKSKTKVNGKSRGINGITIYFLTRLSFSFLLRYRSDPLCFLLVEADMSGTWGRRLSRKKRLAGKRLEATDEETRCCRRCEEEGAQLTEG